MLEEIDYSEEAKYDLFESVSKEKEKEKLDWIACLICQIAPPYEKISEKLKKKNIQITKKQYEKVCKEMGYKY